MSTYKKDLNDPKYWEHFKLGYLTREEQPTKEEAYGHFIGLLVKIDRLEEEVKRAQHETKCAIQQFDTFAMEVSNLAHKRRPVNPYA